MVPISSQAEGDLHRLEDGTPWTSKERCSAGGGVARSSWHDFRASEAFASWGIFGFRWRDNNHSFVQPFD